MVGTADASNISFGDTANAKAGRINYDHSTDAMRFFTNDSEKMRIASNGRVGIGTSSPERLLHLQSAAPEIMMKDSDDNSYNTILSNGGVLSFSTGNTEAMRIDSSGNVGIGATTIPEILTVNKSSNGGITGLSINNNYPTTSTASAGTGSGIRFGVNDGSFTSAFGDGRGSEILSVTTSTNGRSRDIVFKTDSGGTLGEVMRIDSSGNVLVSTTDTTPSENNDVSGISLRSNGQVNVSVDGGAGLDINRKTSDGQILRLRKDGTDVGSIGSQSGNSITIRSSDVGVRFSPPNDAIYPISSTGNRDNATDLGVSNVRFRSAYFGGSVYLGGTGSANALDDYEEGTWTPSFEGSTGNPTVTYDRRVGTYTKIGRVVYFQVHLRTSSVSSQGSGNLKIGGLPFTAIVLTNWYAGGGIGFAGGYTADNGATSWSINSNTSVIDIRKYISDDPRDGLEANVDAGNMNTGAGSKHQTIFSGFYFV
jgi:hypothetical protein